MATSGSSSSSTGVRLQAQSVASLESIASVETGLLSLSPEFVTGLRTIAPKKRRGQIRYVLILAIVGVAAVLGSDRAVREFASTHAHPVLQQARERMGRLPRV